MGLFLGQASQGESAPPFSPSDISDLHCWYGDTMNGVDRSTLSDGATVSVWNDLSGNGRHINTGAGTFTFVESEQAVTNGSMTTAASIGISGSAKRTTIVIRKDNNNHASARSGNVFGWGGSSSGRRWLHEIYTANRFSINGYFMDMYWTYNDGGYFVAGDKYIIINYNTGTNGTSIDCRLNGAQGIDLNTSSTTINTTNAALNVREIANAWMYECMMYSKELSLSEMQQIESYANAKYSIY